MAWLFSKTLIGSVNSPYSPEQEAESSAESCLAGELFVPSSATSTPQACSWRGKTTGALIRFRSGMTFALSTADRGEDVLTWCQEVFPARTSARPERVQELTESSPAYGERWRESLAKYDRDSRSWKTRQFSLLGGLVEFSETWPKWGMTRDGVAYRRKTPFGLLAIRAYITSESESGLSLQTPRATDGDKGTRTAEGIAKEFARGRNVDLPMAITKMPTPNCEGYRSDGELRLLAAACESLEMFEAMSHRACRSKKAKALGTPTARDWKSGKASPATMKRNSRPLSEQVGGQLNPPWVEWLMGWPTDWTDLKPLATDKFQAWLRSHGKS